jgi:crossover junction endodeoxyribonuclease RusA
MQGGLETQRIRDATRQELPEGHFAAQEPLRVRIYYFADAPMNVDLDNIIEPILDSFSRFIYLDDKQVERLEAQKFEPGRLFSFASPSPRLAGTIGMEGLKFTCTSTCRQSEKCHDGHRNRATGIGPAPASL